MSDIRYSIDGQILTDMADTIRNHKGEAASTLTICEGKTLNTYGSTTTASLKYPLRAGKEYQVVVSTSSSTGPTLIMRENSSLGATIMSEKVSNLMGDRKIEFTYTPSVEVSKVYLAITTSHSVEFNQITFTPVELDAYTPQQMVDAVSAALPTKADLVITGNCEKMFSENKWQWMFNKYGNLMTTKDITHASYMFQYCNTVPFTELNFKPGTSIPAISMLGANNTYTLPKLNNFKPNNLMYTFQECRNIREFPEGYFDTWDWNEVDNNNYSMSGIISKCYSLRKYPMEVLQHGNKNTTTASYCWLYYLINANYCLDEMIDIPKPPNGDKSITSNIFSYTVNDAGRLKDFTFQPGITLNWKNQTLDMSQGVGYCTSLGFITGYNSGITEDKAVNNDEAYQALKNDPDWFATSMAYSRYDHDSAVRTINSLPTMLQTGCVIKFRGAAGEKTDAGAINTLTEEEIAVATAKGWTVTLV